MQGQFPLGLYLSKTLRVVYIAVPPTKVLGPKMHCGFCECYRDYSVIEINSRKTFTYRHRQSIAVDCKAASLLTLLASFALHTGSSPECNQSLLKIGQNYTNYKQNTSRNQNTSNVFFSPCNIDSLFICQNLFTKHKQGYFGQELFIIKSHHYLRPAVLSASLSVGSFTKIPHSMAATVFALGG